MGDAPDKSASSVRFEPFEPWPVGSPAGEDLTPPARGVEERESATPRSIEELEEERKKFDRELVLQRQIVEIGNDSAADAKKRIQELEVIIEQRNNEIASRRHSETLEQVLVAQRSGLFSCTRIS